MEIRVIRETNDEMEMEIIGENHTFCGALQAELRRNPAVLEASYRTDHPLLGHPVVYLRVKEIPVPKKKAKTVPLTEIRGVGPKRVEQLRKAGIASANGLLRANPEKLSEKTGIPLGTLQALVEEAKQLDYGQESVPRYVLKQSLQSLEERYSKIRKSFGAALHA
jgi:DNA-directed RNA polymerase subunit L